VDEKNHPRMDYGTLIRNKKTLKARNIKAFEGLGFSWLRVHRVWWISKEHQNIEYKPAWRDEYLKWICGYANDDGGIQ
jgi:hypothetical protein